MELCVFLTDQSSSEKTGKSIIRPARVAGELRSRGGKVLEPTTTYQYRTSSENLVCPLVNEDTRPNGREVIHAASPLKMDLPSNVLCILGNFYLGTSYGEHGDSGSGIFNLNGSIIGMSIAKKSFRFSRDQLSGSNINFGELADHYSETKIVSAELIFSYKNRRSICWFQENLR